MRRLLDVLAVEFPSAKQGDGGVLSAAGIAVDAIEEVGAPRVGHVGALVEAHVVLVVIACHLDGVLVGSGVAEQEVARGKTHAEHLLSLGVAVKARVLVFGVTRIDPQLEITPVLLELCAGTDSHAT